MKKTGDQTAKKQNAFDQIMNVLKNNTSLTKTDLLLKQSTDDLKLAYQHLGGAVSKLPNGQRHTFVTLLLKKKEIMEVPLLAPLSLLQPPLLSKLPLAPLLLPEPE